jgi:hypothetical protein
MRQNCSEFPGGVFSAPEAKISQRTNMVGKKLGDGAVLEWLRLIKRAQGGVAA